MENTNRSIFLLKNARIFRKNLTSSKQLQKVLTLYSGLGIFTIGILVAAVSIIPLYHQLRKAQERDIEFAIQTRSMAIEEFLSRAKDVAEQISSRTQARQVLEEYNRGDRSRKEAVEFNNRVLTEAMNRSEDILGISRFDLGGELIVSVGLPIPPQFPLLPPTTELQDAIVSEPIELEGEFYSIVTTPILNPAKERMGIDIVLFRVSSLQQIVQDYTGLGKSGEIVLGAVRNDRVQLLFPLRNPATEASDALLAAIEKAIASNSDLPRRLNPQKLSTPKEAIVFESLSNPNWGLAVKMDREELYAPVHRQLMLVGMTIVLLSSLGTGGIMLLLRPLTVRVAISDELEQQVRDKTEALQELKHTQAQLIQTEKMSSLGQMVAGVAHEINNPVNFISGNLSYVDEYTNTMLQLVELYQLNSSNPATEIQDYIEDSDLEFLKKDLPKLLSSMKVGTDRINQIVLSLRNFSRLDEAQMKPVDIHSGIDSTLLILQHRLKAQPDRQVIQVVKDYGDLPQVECYANQLNQVFMNLLSNAIDALEMKDGQWGNSDVKMQHNSSAAASPPLPTIWIRTEVVDSNWVAIHIKDNGSGIPETVRGNIFNPFFTTKPVGKGTGLGLSISHQIVVEKHCGKMQVYSSPATGTEFTLEIPTRQLLVSQAAIENLKFLQGMKCEV